MIATAVTQIQQLIFPFERKARVGRDCRPKDEEPYTKYLAKSGCAEADASWRRSNLAVMTVVKAAQTRQHGPNFSPLVAR